MSLINPIITSHKNSNIDEPKIGEKRRFALNDESDDESDIIPITNPKKKRRTITEDEDEDEDVIITFIKNPKKNIITISEDEDEDDDAEDEYEDEDDDEYEDEDEDEFDDFIDDEDEDEDVDKLLSMREEGDKESNSNELEKIESEFNLLFMECKSPSITDILQEIKRSNTTYSLQSLSGKLNKLCCMCQRKKNCGHVFDNNYFVGTLCIKRLVLLLEIAKEYYSFSKFFKKKQNITKINIKTWKDTLHYYEDEMININQHISLEGKKRACYM
jgi:hypothetical protein